MTKAQASDIQAKWQRQDPHALCEHPVQELSRSGLDDEVHLLSMYHCRECGEAIVHTIRPST
jgi:hypothetical protein